jgi:hypothetical protein
MQPPRVPVMGQPGQSYVKRTEENFISQMAKKPFLGQPCGIVSWPAIMAIAVKNLLPATTLYPCLIPGAAGLGCCFIVTAVELPQIITENQRKIADEHARQIYARGAFDPTLSVQDQYINVFRHNMTAISIEIKQYPKDNAKIKAVFTQLYRQQRESANITHNTSEQDLAIIKNLFVHALSIIKLEQEHRNLNSLTDADISAAKQSLDYILRNID